MITSTKNTRIVEARKLAQRKHRQKQNRFLVEGLQLLSIAVEVMATPLGQARVKPLEVFYCETLFTGNTAPRLLAQLTDAGATPLEVSPNVLDTLSERDTSQGLAATFVLNTLEDQGLGVRGQEAGSRGASSKEAGLQENTHYSLRITQPRTQNSEPGTLNPELILVLDKLQDPGNLGTLIRTADAVGVQAIILLEPCVDPFDPKTVRGTMGSLFTVPFCRVKEATEVLPRLAEMGYRLVGADANQGQTVWQSDLLTGSVALVLGNEARGLSKELHQYLAGYVSLPIHGHAESLNVSIAGGVLMYEWLRNRGQGLGDRIQEKKTES